MGEGGNLCPTSLRPVFITLILFPRSCFPSDKAPEAFHCPSWQSPHPFIQPELRGAPATLVPGGGGGRLLPTLPSSQWASTPVAVEMAGVPWKQHRCLLISETITASPLPACQLPGKRRVPPSCSELVPEARFKGRKRFWQSCFPAIKTRGGQLSCPPMGRSSSRFGGPPRPRPL